MAADPEKLSARARTEEPLKEGNEQLEVPDKSALSN